MIWIGDVGGVSEGDVFARTGNSFEVLVFFEDVYVDSRLSCVVFEFKEAELIALILRMSSSVRSSQVVRVGSDGSEEVMSIKTSR
jgi:hypothetical protein